MITSKLSRKGRTTIPLPVRRALRLAADGDIAYRIEGDRVVLTRAEPGVADDPLAIFSEWLSEADRQAYAEL